MMVVKFRDAESRTNFQNFLTLVTNYGVYRAEGIDNGWVIDYNSEKSFQSALKYLHSLGAFKYYNED